MYALAGIALLAAIVAETLGQKKPDQYKGLEPEQAPDGFRTTRFGAGEQRRWHYGGLVDELKTIDNMMFKVTKGVLGMIKGAALAAKKGILVQLNAQRDALIAEGYSPSSKEVAQIDNRFRSVVSTVIGTTLTTKLEHAIADLKAKRDKIVAQIGKSGLISDWSKYGGMYGINIVEDQYGQLTRTDLFGQMQRGDLFGYTPQRIDLFGSDEEEYGYMPQRTDFFGYTPKRTDFFGELTDVWSSDKARTSTNSQWWDNPGTDNDVWIDAWYGTLPSDSRFNELTKEATGIIKSELGWKGVASKGLRIQSLNNQRDEMIRNGVPTSSPKVKALEDEGLRLMVDAGMQPGGPAHRRLMQIQVERDALLRQAA